MAKPLYAIEYAEDVADDLAGLRAYERKNILDAIDKQLSYEPTREVRHKKMLFGLVPPWEHIQPVWQSVGCEPGQKKRNWLGV